MIRRAYQWLPWHLHRQQPFHPTCICHGTGKTGEWLCGPCSRALSVLPELRERSAARIARLDRQRQEAGLE